MEIVCIYACMSVFKRLFVSFIYVPFAVCGVFIISSNFGK